MTASEPFSFQSASDTCGVSFSRKSVAGYTLSANPDGFVESTPQQLSYASLMPVARVSTETSLTILRQELQKAHQLLAQQQQQIQSLVEQSESRELHLQQTQLEVTTLRQACDRQTAQIVEMQSISGDLKTQLKRQQQRVLQYRTLLERAQDQPLFAGSLQSHGQGGWVPSTSTRNRNEEPAKVQADEEWLVQSTQRLMGPDVAQRKLLTLGLSPTVDGMEVENDPQQAVTVTKLYEDITLTPMAMALTESTQPRVTPKFEVDLPCFTKPRP
jgi:hypothetical protein